MSMEKHVHIHYGRVVHESPHQVARLPEVHLWWSNVSSTKKKSIYRRGSHHIIYDWVPDKTPQTAILREELLNHGHGLGVLHYTLHHLRYTGNTTASTISSKKSINHFCQSSISAGWCRQCRPRGRPGWYACVGMVSARLQICVVRVNIKSLLEYVCRLLIFS